jgi:hypothetical protein
MLVGDGLVGSPHIRNEELSDMKRSMWRRAFDTIMVYALWFIIIIFAIWVLLVARGAINLMYIFTTFNRWGLRAVDRWSLVFFGLAMTAGIVVAEDYLRVGAEKGILYLRFAKAAGAVVFTGAALTLLQSIG